jgi:hypothetical protein
MVKNLIHKNLILLWRGSEGFSSIQWSGTDGKVFHLYLRSADEIILISAGDYRHITRSGSGWGIKPGNKDFIKNEVTNRYSSLAPSSLQKISKSSHP